MLQYLLKISKGFRGRILGLVLLGWLQVFLSLTFVWYSKSTIDIAIGKVKGELVTNSIILVLLVAAQILIQLISSKVLSISYVKLSNHIRSQLFSEVLYVRWENLQLLHSGDFLTRSLNDTNDVVSLLLNSIPSALSALVQFLGAFAMLYYFDPTLAFFIVLITPVLLLFSKFYFRRMRVLTKAVKESESSISKYIQESFQGQLVIRAFEGQMDRIGGLEEIQDEFVRKIKSKTSVSTFTNAVLLLTFRGGFLAAFIRGIFLLSIGSISFGTLTAFLQLVGRLQAPMGNIMGVFSAVVSATTSIDRLSYLQGIDKEEWGKAKVLEAPIKLSIRHVTFAYSSEECDVYRDFSLTVNPGEMVGIVGESGAGKSTLLRLLLGLIKPTSGEIVVSNDFEEVEVSEKTRPNFVYVPQGGSLFSGTIRDNLLIGNPQADDERLIEVLEMASAQFVMNELPMGLDSVVGELGARLSEGQAQRIAIARSLLRSGEILLLDEPTSALDPRTAKSFLRNLKELMGEKTILIITHQHEVAEYCDEIIFIPNLSRQ